MDHPYTELEKTRLWAAVESAIKDLVSNNDLVESTTRPYIVGYLCQKLLNERRGVVEGMSLDQKRSPRTITMRLSGTKATSSIATSRNFRNTG